MLLKGRLLMFREYTRLFYVGSVEKLSSKIYKTNLMSDLASSDLRQAIQSNLSIYAERLSKDVRAWRCGCDSLLLC